MELTGFKDRHRCGYRHAGICISCRRGEENCIGGRFRNDCSNYLDNSPTKEEYMQQYAELLQLMFAAEGEPARGDLYGAAQSKRKFLRVWIGIDEKEIRAVEDSVFYDKDKNGRDLRKLRWEL